jgi:hypothetical protein
MRSPYGSAYYATLGPLAHAQPVLVLTRAFTAKFERFAISYLLYERCARATTHFRRSAGRGAAW